ncbi:MAG TPA: ParA family protein [Aquella sp.]|nr:ParA family protein [Aquella sp.]
MILAVCNSKGGVFKTGTAINLMVFLNKYNPVLVDLDRQKSGTLLNNMRQQFAKALDVITINSEKELEQIINKSTKDNLFIIDTGGFDSSLTRIAIITADVLISPTSSHAVELLGLSSFETILQELSEVKKETIKTNVFINDIHPAIKNFTDIQNFINASDNFNLLNSIVRTRTELPNAMDKGLSVKEFNPKGKATQEFKALTKEIEQLLFKI